MDYRALFEQSPSRLLVVSPDPPRWTVKGANDSYFEVTHTTRDIVGRAMFAEVFPGNPDEPDADGSVSVAASFQRALTTRAPDAIAIQRYDIRVGSGGYVERYWAPIHTPIVAPDGSVTAVLHRVEDVTAYVKGGETLKDEADRLRREVVSRARELAAANQTLRDLVEQHRKLAAIVAHDLRTPLSAIVTGAAVLRRRFDVLGTPAPRVLDIVEASGARMKGLLNDLDDFASLHFRGALSIHREHVNLRTLCEEVLDAASVSDPGREFTLEASESIAADVDPRRMRQLVANLVSNAVSYGAAGRPVRVALQRVTGACVITVSNEGESIPEDVIPGLFEAFRRGPAADEPQQGGHMGLGLYIVQQIARAHGATIDVDSTPSGTHFRVYVPVRG